VLAFGRLMMDLRHKRAGPPAVWPQTLANVSAGPLAGLQSRQTDRRPRRPSVVVRRNRRANIRQAARSDCGARRQFRRLLMISGGAVERFIVARSRRTAGAVCLLCSPGSPLDVSNNEVDPVLGQSATGGELRGTRLGRAGATCRPVRPAARRTHRTAGHKT
jgi:hypothetical protein